MLIEIYIKHIGIVCDLKNNDIIIYIVVFIQILYFVQLFT